MKAKANKGRPAQISKEEIIECALKIGLQTVSMHSLGKQLGVSATALYRHVSSKDELIILCCDYVMEKVALPKETEWDQYLYTFARNFRMALLSLPGSVEFIRYNQQFTPKTSILANDALGVFRQAQFDAEVGFMAFASVFTKVTDIVQHQEQAQQRHTDSEQQMLPSVDAEKLPNLAWLLSQTKPVDYDRYFEDGIKITIEGLKAVYR
ncbi:TetR/AcrR family transcriptional regulator [Photobacterium sanctipauli]|uniref:TetR/AcrR family transcriptional regulator n=1 Tax=Photobacterium sanctipauli TaxID=1342794 RepID=A0A2T3P0P4_9GAMM|nr:TetR/AcrR family transcriptional regulator [Photobacterium sanctipauli]PSW22096.1 TetR/AcrR family transcriptional regulator [Photobacterium sanctipauli]